MDKDLQRLAETVEASRKTSHKILDLSEHLLALINSTSPMSQTHHCLNQAVAPVREALENAVEAYQADVENFEAYWKRTHA